MAPAPRGFCSLFVRCRDASTGKSFLCSVLVATLSGALSACIFVADEKQPFVKDWVPDGVVFNVFVTFASLVAAFRTSNALGRYTDAAMYLHRLSAAWFDTTSTLIAFCRVAQAPAKEVEKFKEVLIRLISLMNALCLEYLESGGHKDLRSRGRAGGFRFQLLGSEDLGPEMCSRLFSSEHKVEYVFQMLQQLIVDAQASGVLSIAPPILTRSHQEMGAGIFCYHEAKKIACVPLPTAYFLITMAILVIEAVYMPFMMAQFVQGAFSAFLYTFGGTFLLWFVNSVADTLDNPFRKEAQTLDASSVQHELNEQLLQLLEQSRQDIPSLFDEAWTEPGVKKHCSTRNSLSTWQRMLASEVEGEAVEKVASSRFSAWKVAGRGSSFFVPESPKKAATAAAAAQGVTGSASLDSAADGFAFGASMEAEPRHRCSEGAAGGDSGGGGGQGSAPPEAHGASGGGGGPRGGPAECASRLADVHGSAHSDAKDRPPVRQLPAGMSATSVAGSVQGDLVDSVRSDSADGERGSAGQRLSREHGLVDLTGERGSRVTYV